jgi:catechol 2,3-dioxygenase-like lactoylglutathione lyase family enzyme
MAVNDACPRFVRLRGLSVSGIIVAVAAIRYFVSDVDRALEFYTRHLGFRLKQQAGAAIAGVEHGDLTVWLSGPQSSAGRPLADGQQASAGGWNRFILEVTDLAVRVDELKRAGVRFRGDIVGGPGGTKALVEDPDGNLIELFEPTPK